MAKLSAYKPTSRTVVRGKINQGDKGTCTVLASAVGNLEYKVHDSNEFRYAFLFHDEEAGKVWVSGRSPKRDGKDMTRAIENAYDKFKQRYDGYAAGATFQGNWENEVLTDITGVRHHTIYPDLPGGADELLRNIDVGEVIGIFSGNMYPQLVDGHAYSVFRIGENFIQLFNPWGVDGYKSYDGRDDGLVCIGRGEINAMNTVDGIRYTQPINEIGAFGYAFEASLMDGVL